MEKACPRGRTQPSSKKWMERLWWYLFNCRTKSAPRGGIFRGRDSTVIAVKKETLHFEARGVDSDSARQNSNFRADRLWDKEFEPVKMAWAFYFSPFRRFAKHRRVSSFLTLISRIVMQRWWGFLIRVSLLTHNVNRSTTAKFFYCTI